MTATRHLAPWPRLRAPRAVAILAWGIDLHAGPDGELHESLADAELIDPFTGRPDLEAVVGTEQHGPPFSGDLLVISRTVVTLAGGLGEVSAAVVAPPTRQETAAVHAALDYLGYTGPRQVRLLLTVDCS